MAVEETDVIDQIAPEAEEEVEEQEEQATEGEEEVEEIEEKQEEKEQVEPVPTVPLAALKEERERRQELQSRLDETQQKIGRMEALFERFQGEKPEDLPSYDDDPAGFLRASIEKMEKKLAEMGESQTEHRKQEEVREQERQLLEKYATATRTFTSRQPDFNDAYSWLAGEIDKDLQNRGIMDPTERASIIQYEEGQMVGRAMREGRDPAEQIYNYAKARGWKKEDDDKLERITKGQSASKSLNNSGGKGAPPTTLERLAELDGEEFDKAWNKAVAEGRL